MLNRIYIEKDVKSHPKTIQICNKFNNAPVINCDHYSEVFNRKAQNFRLQKKSPGLVLAHKHKNLVMPAPSEYSIGGDLNFYFSHMLNCIYDCRYCFLQGMYRSANYVLFVNYEDFYEQIKSICNSNADNSCHFFSGYDCDSLAMEPVTGFMQYLLPNISDIPNLLLELRTKSTQIRTLLDIEPINNCVIAYSLLPDRLAKALDHKAPDISSRLASARKLQDQGWNIGLRFDPLIYDTDLEKTYQTFFTDVANKLDVEKIHSVSIGSFRLPADYFNKLSSYYPEDKLFTSPFKHSGKSVSYKNDVKKRLLSYCYQEICSYYPLEKIFPCEALEQYI